MPGTLASTVSELVRPGIMSSLPPSFGAQKLWITLALVSSISTGRPTGMRSSLALSIPPPGAVPVDDAPPPALAHDGDFDRFATRPGIADVR